MNGERTGPDKHRAIVTGLALVLGAILLVILLQIVHYVMFGREYARKVLDAPHAEYATLAMEQRAELTAGVTIEEAMAEVVRRHGGEGADEQRTER
jgi:hypothetical protein